MKKALLILVPLITIQVSAQRYVLDSMKPLIENLINYEANTFKLASESPTFDKFFKKLDSIYSGKQQKLHIFHIGGSHIQADIYSNKIRTYLQNTNELSQGQRGFVFPYHLAHTNNPTNYRISGNKDLWQGYRSSLRKDSIAWGLSGVTAAFRMYEDTLYIKSNYKNYTKRPYDFNGMRVFFNTWKGDYSLKILDSSLVISDTLNSDKMYREYRFNRPVDSIALHIQLKDTTLTQPEFAMMGIEYMNENPGIQYTSIGVNGASFEYYKRAIYFEKQLAIYKPDMFIISIGTNDAYMPKSKFDAEKFRNNYDSFIQMIQRINPDCAILLTVPNDDYYRRKYLNPNTAVQQSIIMDLAQKYHMAVWDFYEVMGGLGSSNKWYQKKLMPRDRIHFTFLGYSIKADLFMDAMIDAWSKSNGRDKNELLTHYHTMDE